MQNFEWKYSLRVKIFEFYPSARTLFESTESEFLGHRAAKMGKKSSRKTLHTTGAKFLSAGVALCRVQGATRRFATVYQWCIKFLSWIFYPFWLPYSRKFRFGTFDRGMTNWYFWPGSVEAHFDGPTARESGRAASRADPVFPSLECRPHSHSGVFPAFNMLHGFQCTSYQ